jgi:ribosomal protein L7/L12
MHNFDLAEGQNLEGRLVEITGYLRAGKKINAIKIYREVTGASLAEAKDAVDRLDMAIKLYGTMVVGEAIMEAMQQGMQQQGMPMNMDIQSM